MKRWQKVLIIILVVVIIIQFIHPSHNISNAAQPNNITKVYATSDNVQNILAKACYDCHSNNTRYPWYAKIQPVDWWLTDHVEEGKRHLNFDEFAAYKPSRQYHSMKESVDEVKNGDMPLGSYTLIHSDAKLTDAQKQAFINWCQSIRTTLELRYPADSLKMPQRPRKED